MALLLSPSTFPFALTFIVYFHFLFRIVRVFTAALLLDLMLLIRPWFTLNDSLLSLSRRQAFPFPRSLLPHADIALLLWPSFDATPQRVCISGPSHLNIIAVKQAMIPANNPPSITLFMSVCQLFALTLLGNLSILVCSYLLNYLYYFLHICQYMCLYISLSLSLSIYIYIYECVCVCVYVYIYIYIYIYLG